MDSHPERRRYYPDEENVPLSEVVREALEAHESASLSADELDLYDSVNPEAIDDLFRNTDDVDVTVRIELTNVTVSIWEDGGIDVRVTDDVA